MFHFGHRKVIPTLIVGGLMMSLPVAIQGATAAPAGAIAQQAPADADITAKIRKSLEDDKALAGYVSTLKVVVSDGLVTLKGAVRSEADKKAIGQKVEAIVGEANVMNNLFVSQEAAAKPTPETA